MVDILAAVPSDGLPAVEAACAEAVREGVHSAGVVINILARRRDPAAPVTILTPEALRLQHESAADCARYDSPRRTTRWKPPRSSPPWWACKLRIEQCTEAVSQNV